MHNNNYNIVIIGGGITGASVAYHLYSLEFFKGKVILLESGTIGEGNNTEFKLQSSVNKNSSGGELTYKPLQSGSKVLDNPNRIKMIATNFESTAVDFLGHHGMSGITLYNKIAELGRDLQYKLAKLYLNNDKDISNLDNNSIPDNFGLIQLGSLMLCFEPDLKDFEEEYDLLKKGGYECEWWDKEKVQNIHGTESGFHAGIFFPKDGIIDSSQYAKKLVESAKNHGLEVLENTRVIDVEELLDDNKKIVKVVLENQKIIYGNKIVMATGGLNLDKNINGIIKPSYSYISALKSNINYDLNSPSDCNIEKMKNTPNFFTFGFTHDWSMCQGYLRISGCDHMSALKTPEMVVRCKNLDSWAFERYPMLKKNTNLHESKYMNAVYSETPDMLPVLGSISDESNIFYLVGCNAWGQAILSAGSYLIPGLLGERILTKEEKEMVNFISIRRFNFNILRANF
jgi:glycine/D-amino acid oxidase-like deaminating enzyme